MITHLVLCKPREDLSETERQELDDVLASLVNVPVVQGFTHGDDFSGRSRGFGAVAAMYFEDREQLQMYMQHPLHLQVVEALNRLAPDRLVVDYETGTSGISATAASAQSPS